MDAVSAELANTFPGQVGWMLPPSWLASLAFVCPRRFFGFGLGCLLAGNREQHFLTARDSLRKRFAAFPGGSENLQIKSSEGDRGSSYIK
jgi:hypothetical protein